MKWLLIFWGGPVMLLTGWYGLSYYDMSFGVFMLTREAHELVLPGLRGISWECRRKPFRRSSPGP